MKIKEQQLKAIGLFIRSTRKHQRKTQAKLAHAAGISRTFLIEIEKGTVNCSIAVLISVSRALNHQITIEPHED